MKKRHKQVLTRRNWAAIAMSSAFGAAALSQLNAQVLSAGSIVDKATTLGRYKKESRIAPQRGDVVTQDKQILARTLVSYEFFVNFAKVPQSRAFFADLGAAAGVSPAELEAASAVQPRTAFYRELLTASQGAAVERVRDLYRADGVSLRKIVHREYPFGKQTSAILGTFRVPLNPDTDKPILDEKGNTLPETGQNGLEEGLNRALSGTEGIKVGVKDSDGNFLPLRLQKSVPCKDGARIELTLDSSLQRLAAEQIETAVRTNQATTGVAIVMDLKQGDILAMAQYPAYDPMKNLAAHDFNAATMLILEPGSTFKILTLAEALERGKAEVGERINSSGTLTYRGVTVHDAHPVAGAVTQERAIAESSNVLAATWATRLGREGMRSFLARSGLTSPTNIGLPRESRGSYIASDQSISQTMVMGFGQGFRSTPLAFLSAFSAIGSEGRRIVPRLINKIDDRLIQPVKQDQLFRPEIANYVLSLMEGVFHRGGTGAHLQIPGYRLAGKTGTAEKKGSATGGYVANFVGFVPAEKPRAIVLVMVDNPLREHFGGQVAGPVFRELARSLIQRYHITPLDAQQLEVLKHGPTAEEQAKMFEATQTLWHVLDGSAPEYKPTEQ